MNHDRPEMGWRACDGAAVDSRQSSRELMGTTMKGELLQIATDNDKNGNARRTWILVGDGAVVDGELEDCSGKPERFRDFMAVRINVSPAEWRSWNQQLAAVLAWQAKVAALSGVA